MLIILIINIIMVINNYFVEFVGMLVWSKHLMTGEFNTKSLTQYMSGAIVVSTLACRSLCQWLNSHSEH